VGMRDSLALRQRLLDPDNLTVKLLDFLFIHFAARHMYTVNTLQRSSVRARATWRTCCNFVTLRFLCCTV
jgi:hypothetical protein